MTGLVQVSIDVITMEEALALAHGSVRAGVDWLEVGTPLLLGEGLSHEEAMAMLVARVLVSPDFLYKLEVPPPGESPQPVDA